MIKKDEEYPLWLFQLMAQKQGFKKNMRYFLLEDLETNYPQLCNMKTFYRSWRKQKAKIFNQKNYEQFAQFDDETRFHDEVYDELQDGGYELEQFNQKGNLSDEDLAEEA